MSDAFLPGNGFDTYETQDKVLVSMDGTVDCGVAVRILQQQGFGVAAHALQFVIGTFRMGEAHHFHLGELVHAYHAARILAV